MLPRVGLTRRIVRARVPRRQRFMAKIEMDHTDVRADSTKQMSELKLEVKELRRLIRSKNRELDESLASLEHMQQNGLVDAASCLLSPDSASCLPVSRDLFRACRRRVERAVCAGRRTF